MQSANSTRANTRRKSSSSATGSGSWRMRRGGSTRAARAQGRVAEALLTERELNLRERQSQESSISSLLDQSAYDRITINVSLVQ